MLVKMETGASGGGGTVYTLTNVGGTWYILKNEEVFYRLANAYGNAITNQCSDENITITKSANSYSYTVTYNKSCDETTLPVSAMPSTTSKSAGNSSTFDITNTGFIAIFS